MRIEGSRRYSRESLDRMKIGDFLRIDSRESIPANRPDSRCESPGHLSRRLGSSEKAFVSQKRVSGFPEKRLTSGEVRGTSGEVRETSGEPLGNFRGTSEKLPGNLWIAIQFHSERTGEVAENFRGSSGDFRGSPGTFQKLGGA